MQSKSRPDAGSTFRIGLFLFEQQPDPQFSSGCGAAAMMMFCLLVLLV